jgi:pimeloyl-ACP methyl ester carboxylesterase
MPEGRVAANGIEIAYETSGPDDGRPLLLIMGLGAQMLVWHPDFVGTLVERGFRVVRFDNRDVGLSTHLHDSPVPDLMAALMTGDTSSAAYTFDDMADDAAGLLDGLGIDSAHVVGVSLGGMIAQVLAGRHPARVRSLTSMSSTPAPALADPAPHALAALSAPPATSREGAVTRMVEVSRVVGSPGYPLDEAWLTELAGMMYDRGADPMGVARQTMASYASGDRTEAVRALTVPTLVIHGEDDPLIKVTAGRATAELIEDAELLVIPGMGHDLPRPLWPQIADAITALADRAEGQR